MRAQVVWVLQVFDLGLLAYFIAINSLHLLFSIVAYLELRRHRRKRTSHEHGAVMRSPATPAISLIVRAHNLESTIHEKLKSFLDLNFPQFEVVVVNDGSTDRTAHVAIKAFDLIRAPMDNPQPLGHRPVLGIYRSLINRDLVLVDKEHGGRADAINAGINAARHPLVCVIDADSLLEDETLARAVLPFVEDPRTVAAGGMVRIANGCRAAHGRVVEVSLPKSRLAMFQVVERLRASVTNVAESVFQVPTIPNAFGIFRRDLIIEAGGFRAGSADDDSEIVARLHEVCRERGQPCRIVFQPDAICWTYAPETVQALANLRRDRQLGTLQMLVGGTGLMFNARRGVAGLFAWSRSLIVGGVGPLVEFTAYVLTVAAVALGLLDWRFAEMLFLVAVIYGSIVSLAAVLLQELSPRPYPRVMDLLRLAAYSLLANIGYRQLTMWWRVRGFVDFLSFTSRPPAGDGWNRPRPPAPAVLRARYPG